MSNHTPGPWDIGPDGFGNWTVYRVENGHEIASIYPDGYQLFCGDGWEEQMDADAHLIAAAPEMKRLLYKAHEKLAELNNNYELDCDDSPVNLCYEIRTLLRRIEGQEDEE